MKRLQSGKALPILLALLVIAAGVGVALNYTKWSESRMQGGLQNRMQVAAALRQAVLDIQDQTKKWPKNIDELKDHPKVKDVLGSNVGNLKYTFIKVDARGAAHYQYENGEGKPKDVPIMPRSLTPKNPIQNGDMAKA